jgi:3-oxoacyl-(acyl-carrier-protein) synthase
MKNRRVVVTGMGVIAANGTGLRDFSSALREGRSGISYIKELEEHNFACWVGGKPKNVEEKLSQYFANDEILALNESMIYAGMASIDAFKDAGLTLPKRDEDLIYEDTGAIVGTGIGGLDTFSKVVYPLVAEKKVKRLGSTIVERIMASAVSAKVGGLLGLGNQVSSNSSACSTGTEAIIMGTNRIKMGLADRMVVGGAEGTDLHVWCGFDSMKVLSRRYNDAPEKASRPMSASAGGFVPSGGCGILVVEELQTALKRGARIYGEIIGTAINSGGMRFGGSMTAPSPKGVQRCIRLAMVEAGITGADIDYINGHLTATMADPKEINNWKEALEITPEKLPHINSTKSMIGHSLGAAGAIESVATLLQMNEGFVHGSLNCEDLHPEIEAYAGSVVRSTMNKSIEIAAKASFGFGDVNSCIIFKKWSHQDV